MSEFGDKFRKERERKKISLEEVSNATKISSRMLRAIEDEQFDRLPGGVFNKGFIRSYAKHLGLNEEEAVAGYLACIRREQAESDVWDAHLQTPQHEELPDLQLPRAEHVGPPRRDYFVRRESAVPWRISILVVLVVVLALLLWHRHSRSARDPAASAAPAIAATQPAAGSSSESAPVGGNLSSGVQPAAETKLPVRSSPARVPALTPRPTVLASATPNPALADIQKTSNVQTETVPGPIATEQPSPAPLSLVIRASENSWISVNADGRSVLHELLVAPARTSVHATREIEVRVGNAAGVTFLWNGQEIPAQGAEAEVKTLVFDASGMRVLPDSQAPSENP